MIDVLGDGHHDVPACRARAAQKIGCDRTTVGRWLAGTKALTHAQVLKLLKAGKAHSPELGEKALLATRSPEAGRRMDRYFDWLDSQLERHATASRRFSRCALPLSYEQPNGILYKFREWMCERGIRPARQELAIWRVLEPLVEARENGWVEVGIRDLLSKDPTGSLLKKDLSYGIDREKLHLEVRGPDQHRVRHLAAAAEADEACFAAQKLSPAEVDFARAERSRIFHENRIPELYTFRMTSPPTDTRDSA